MITSESQVKKKCFNMLVEGFKEIRFRSEFWINPYEVEGFEQYHVLNPWNLWYGDLDADILLIGQDWGNKTGDGGLEFLLKEKKAMATDYRLKELFNCLHYELEAPYAKLNGGKTINHKLFFTNAILGIRNGDKNSGNIPKDSTKISLLYLKLLIDIIKPKNIITLGKTAYTVTYDIYKAFYPTMLSPSSKMDTLIEESPIYLENENLKIFPVFHCSARSINRKFDEQKADWEKIRENLNP